MAKGIEIQNARAFYHARIEASRVMPGEVYPQTLADLTRLPKPFLRKMYLDPTGHGEWGYLRAPTDGIMAVRSKNRAKPFWQRDLPPPSDRHFEGRPPIVIGSSNIQVPHQLCMVPTRDWAHSCGDIDGRIVAHSCWKPFHYTANSGTAGRASVTLPSLSRRRWKISWHSQ